MKQQEWMMKRLMPVLLAGLAVATAAPAFGSSIPAEVERLSKDRLSLRWQDTRPVDIYVSDIPNAVAAKSDRLASGDRGGEFTYSGPIARPYFIVRDGDGAWSRVAERQLELEKGSNFRDVGGYPAAAGKHVRWGLIYRSAATPLLSDADIAKVGRLNIRDLVDLRSSEERVLAPTRLNGIRYSAIGYSMSGIIERSKQAGAGGGLTGIYRDFPTMLAPQLRLIFEKLLDAKGAIAYNCSAGQDRTGFATAMILYALGVPRDVIDADYLLSTRDRRPEFEMPKIDLATHPDDPVAKIFAQGQQGSEPRKPTSLIDSNHRAYIENSFEEILSRWGSVDAYLSQEIGVGPLEVASLRRHYLE